MVSRIRQQRDGERRARTRRAVLEAAKAVFVLRGYHRTKVSDIVAEAGVGQGTLYRSFENKRQVFETLFDEFMESLLDEFAEMSANLPTGVEEYRAASIGAITRAARVVESSPELVRLFLREGPAIDREFEQKLSDLFDRFADLAQYHLERAIEGGFARPCETRFVAQAVVGIALRHTDLYLNGRLGDASLDEVIPEAVDFAFWGFGPRADTGRGQ